MTSVAVRTSLADVLAGCHDAVDAVATVELEAASRDELLSGWQELERLRNRLASVDAAMITAAQRRGLPGECGARNVVGLLRGLLRVDPVEASARVRAAHATEPRLTPTGHLQPAAMPAVAAAQASGSISPAHAAVIRRALETLPDPVRTEHGPAIETELVGYAREFEPRLVARCATRIRAHHDPDGALADERQRRRERGVDVHQDVDGSGTVCGRLTAETTEALLALLDPLAKPRPAVDGVRDPRSATQRRHDALLDLLHLALRSGQAPDSNGVTTTVILTASAADWAAGTGFATTAHGALVAVPEAWRWTGGDTRTMAIALDTDGNPVDWTDARRVTTENQRLVAIARDRGCTGPDCDMPPALCEVHHLVDWATGGPTRVINSGLVCEHHHRELVAAGWVARLRRGRIHWIPPAHLDPARRPRLNRLHHAGENRPGPG